MASKTIKCEDLETAKIRKFTVQFEDGYDEGTLLVYLDFLFSNGFALLDDGVARLVLKTWAEGDLESQCPHCTTYGVFKKMWQQTSTDLACEYTCPKCKKGWTAG